MKLCNYLEEHQRLPSFEDYLAIIRLVEADMLFEYRAKPKQEMAGTIFTEEP